MSKKIDLNKSVYELTEEYPELIDIMAKLGFTEITKKAMRHSVGKMVTIPKGAKMKNISMAEIVMALISNGFQLEGEMPVGHMGEGSDNAKSVTNDDTNAESGNGQLNTEERTALLKSYLVRLGEGEELEKVKADFVREFGTVDATEIMAAEKELMLEGTPVTEVQKLCDLHSALFHGHTKEEQIAMAHDRVAASMSHLNDGQGVDLSDKHSITQFLQSIKGHPLETFTRENEQLQQLLDNIKEPVKNKSIVDDLLEEVRQLSIHYAKKGDLLYPHLNVKYDISGPSNVMWTVDDEIRDELGKLAGEETRDQWWYNRLEAVLTRAEEMIFKEQNILFPICAVNFAEEEWFEIYRDAKDYEPCFGVESYVWEDAEAYLTKPAAFNSDSGEVVMPGGHMTVEQLTALLNTIPIEITFVDAENINRFFNEGPKVFKRPGMAIDREVFTCHPPKIEPMVRQIIDSFRDGSQDSVPIWMNKNGRSMLVTYMAVRDKAGKYLGTVELVQDMEFAKEHFSSNK